MRDEACFSDGTCMANQYVSHRLPPARCPEQATGCLSPSKGSHKDGAESDIISPPASKYASICLHSQTAIAQTPLLRFVPSNALHSSTGLNIKSRECSVSGVQSVCEKLQMTMPVHVVNSSSIWSNQEEL